MHNIESFQKNVEYIYMTLWREMSIADIPYVYNIAMDIWTIHKESQTIYENKFVSFPQGCYVYDDNGIKGYIISHPYNISSPPKINTLLPTVDFNGWRYFTLTRVNVKTQQSYTLALCVFNA